MKRGAHCREMEPPHASVPRGGPCPSGLRMHLRTRRKGRMRRTFQQCPKPTRSGIWRRCQLKTIVQDDLAPQTDFRAIGHTRVAPTFVLKYNIRTRSLADQGAIEDVLAVENDVVPFDRADVLEQGCVNAFLGDSSRSHRPCDLLGLPIGFETERSWPGV